MLPKEAKPVLDGASAAPQYFETLEDAAKFSCNPKNPSWCRIVQDWHVAKVTPTEEDPRISKVEVAWAVDEFDMLLPYSKFVLIGQCNDGRFICIDFEHVPDIFRRFDLNEDGTIDCAELAKVLKEIDGEAWTDGRVKELFMSFDSSKDDRIQVDEFCKWLGLAGVKGPTSFAEVARTMGEVLITLVATKVRFDFRRENNFHHIELYPDGTYWQQDNTESGDWSGREEKVTGKYKIVQSLQPATAHKLLLYPLLSSGKSWAGCSESDEWTNKDLSGPWKGAAAACHTIETDLKTLDTGRAPPQGKYFVENPADAVTFQAGSGV